MIPGGTPSVEIAWRAARGSAPLDAMDPGQRTFVVGSLILLTSLGVLAILVAWLAARATRHYMASSSKSTNKHRHPSPREDDWAGKPIIPSGGATEGGGEDDRDVPMP